MPQPVRVLLDLLEGVTKYPKYSRQTNKLQCWAVLKIIFIANMVKIIFFIKIVVNKMRKECFEER